MTLSKTKLKEIARTLKVTDHADYQTYLSLVYAEAKASDPAYSYVRLSDDLGLGSTNAHSVIKGRRPLTVKAATRICESLGLTGVQRRYFLTLVAQARARSSAQRDEAFATRLKIKQQVLPTSLDRRQLAFFEHWYHAAILELMRLGEAQDDPEWIATQLHPPVPAAKVRESLALLQELGYLAPDPQRGRLYPTEATITTGNEVLGLALHSFHRQMLKLALEAIDTVDPEERDISALTLAISRPLHDQIKEELVALRKRILQLAAEVQEPTEILQVNLQMFPLTQRKGTRA